MVIESVSDSQRLHLLAPGTRAASPRQRCSICCGKCAKRISHNIYYIYAEASTDEQARGWRGSLYNNQGWTYHDQGDYERALECFQKALKWQQEHGTARNIGIARWCVGRTLRSMQHTTEALALQQELLADWERSGEEQDGYIFEEIGECLFVLGRAAESLPYFAQAYALLSQDPWLVAHEKERLERLKQLGEESEEARHAQ